MVNTTNITNNDYKKILTYYKKKIPKTRRLLKKEANDILANKLCRCIKEVDPINEAKSIGICTRSIFNKRGYTRGAFSCKKKQQVTFRKQTKKNRTYKR